MDAIKDIIVILTPIIVAYLSYRSNKKSKEEMHLEIEKSLSEKSADTVQILQRINAELESQKQIAAWNNSLPQTDDYISLAGTERYGNISALPNLINSINGLLDDNALSIEDSKELRLLLNRVDLPTEEESLYPYEIISIFNFSKLIQRIDNIIDCV